MAGYLQGPFKPKNPEKYVGDPTKIVYRSSLELRMMMYLDTNENVLRYASEEVSIPYVSPLDNRIHRYFPDIIAKIKNKEGKIETVMIEIKPYRQTLPPKPSKNKKGVINEVKTYAVNQAKWGAAERFCQERGWTFKLVTEKQLEGRTRN